MARRVLIVEAHAEIDPTLTEALAALEPGLQIDRATSLNAAVDLLTSVGYDLIVSEADRDGARAGLFLRHLCERRFPTIPFALLSSAPPDPEDPSLLSRPFSASQLRERLLHLLAS